MKELARAIMDLAAAVNAYTQHLKGRAVENDEHRKNKLKFSEKREMRLTRHTDKDVCMGRILSLKAEGKSLREIEEYVGVSRSSVSRWLKEKSEAASRAG